MMSGCHDSLLHFLYPGQFQNVLLKNKNRDGWLIGLWFQDTWQFTKKLPTWSWSQKKFNQTPPRYWDSQGFMMLYDIWPHIYNYIYNVHRPFLGFDACGSPQSDKFIVFMWWCPVRVVLLLVVVVSSLVPNPSPYLTCHICPAFSRLKYPWFVVESPSSLGLNQRPPAWFWGSELPTRPAAKRNCSTIDWTDLMLK